MTYSGAWDNFKRVIKLFEEELKNAISATENFVTNSDDIRNNLTEYTQQDFEYEFRNFFTVQNIVEIRDSKRILYLMKKSDF